MMKSIFYNELEQNIRAGWRMGIFVVALSGMTVLFNMPAKWMMSHVHFFPSFVSGEIVFYGALLVTTWIVI